jgi:shikimate dehydrogenase
LRSTLFDIDEQKSFALADALRNEQRRMDVRVAQSLQDACEDAVGLINCTPLGMVGYGENAFDDGSDG